MGKIKGITIGMVIVLMAVGLIVYGISCSRNDHDRTAGSSASTTITLSGTFDTTVSYASLSGTRGIWDYLCDVFRPNYAYANGGGIPVNKIYAISYDENGLVLKEATKNGASFSLTLSKGNPYPYIIVFLNDTTVQGLMKLDDGTDLDALPLSASSSNINMGIVSLNGNVVTGTINQADLLNAVGMNLDIASACGVMDEGFLRWCSVDADGNGVLDFTENREYGVGIHFQVAGQTFDDIKGTYSDKTQMTYQGYQYCVSLAPWDVALGFDYETATATMHSPAPINGGNDVTHTYTGTDPYPGGGEYAIYGFYDGQAITDPYTPPQGTYTVTITDSACIITKTFTFLNVSSQTIDNVNLYDVYIPSVKLTVDGDQVTKLEWQWWKNTLAGGWVNPSAAELNAVLDDSSWQIGNWSTGGQDDVGGDIASSWVGTPFATEGSVEVPEQVGWTATALSINYTSKSDYHYHFEWRTNP